MLTIRAYTTDTDQDIAAITAIYGHHVLHGRASFETEAPSVTEMLRRLQAVLDAGFPVIVAELDGHVAGYAYASAFHARAAYRQTVEDSIYVDATLARPMPRPAPVTTIALPARGVFCPLIPCPGPARSRCIPRAPVRG